MCWIGFSRDRRIAKSDIIVYKVFMRCEEYEPDVLVSPFMETEYHLGGHYVVPSLELTNVSSKVLKGDNKIIEGIHCFNKMSCVRPRLRPCRLFGDLHIELHVTPFRCPVIDARCNFVFKVKYGKYYGNTAIRMLYRPVIVRCIIPKNTVYYENYYGHIVTESIILKEIIKTPEKDTIFKNI